MNPHLVKSVLEDIWVLGGDLNVRDLQIFQVLVELDLWRIKVTSQLRQATQTALILADVVHLLLREDLGELDAQALGFWEGLMAVFSDLLHENALKSEIRDTYRFADDLCHQLELADSFTLEKQRQVHVDR